MDLLVERWAAGASLSDIAACLGRTAPQVKAKIRDMRRAGAGDRLPMRRPRQSYATQRQLATMWNDAVPTAEIAATLGISEASVRKRVERMRTQGAPMTTGVERHGRARRHQRQRFANWLAQNSDFGKRLSDASAELGVPVPQLSEDLDALLEAGAVDRETVAILLPNRFSRERRNAILDLARAGHSRSEIARHLGLTTGYVKDSLKYFRRSGALPPAPSPPPACVDDARLTFLWNRGLTGAAIAAEMQVTERAVWNRVKALRASGRPLARRRPRWGPTTNPADGKPPLAAAGRR